MDRQQLSHRIEQTVRVQQVLSFALVAAVAVYAGVGIGLVLGGVVGPVVDLAPEMQALLAGAGIVIVMLSAPLGSSLRSRAEAARPRDPVRLLEAYRRAHFITSVVQETGAVVGFVVTLLTGRPLWVVLTAAVAVLAMIICWPRRRVVEERVLRYGAMG